MRSLFGAMVPRCTLDFSTLEPLPASFVTEHLGQHHADMLWRIHTAGGEWLYLLVLIEFQSTVDRRMALRMVNCASRIWLGLVLPVVIYNGERRWNAPTDIRDLLAPVPEALLGYLPRHRYLLIELQAVDPSLLPPDNVLAMIAKFEQAQSPEEVDELVTLLADWLERVGEPNLVERFRAWITLVVAQRFGSAGLELELKLRKEEEGKMTTLIERSRKWGEELNRQWLEKGITQGIERGRVEGERELVQRLAVRRFGPDATEQFVVVLDAISDPERIATIADAVLECETAEEFMARAREVAGE